MSLTWYWAGVSIEWCRSWQPVTKIIWKKANWCELIEYSDWLDDIWWTEWECPNSTIDAEITCVSENSNLYILRFSTWDWTFLVYDFSWNNVTWTVTPIQCSWSEQYDIRSAWFYCINWTTTLERFDIIDLWTQTIASSIWQDLTWTVVSTPVWVITAWACSVSPSIYDNQEQFRVTWATPPAPYDTDSTDWASITLTANTYKSISIAVLVWFASIVQNGKTHTLWEWYVRNYDVTDLADNSITITQASADCVASITTVTI